MSRAKPGHRKRKTRATIEHLDACCNRYSPSHGGPLGLRSGSPHGGVRRGRRDRPPPRPSPDGEEPAREAGSAEGREAEPEGAPRAAQGREEEEGRGKAPGRGAGPARLGAGAKAPPRGAPGAQGGAKAEEGRQKGRSGRDRAGRGREEGGSEGAARRGEAARRRTGALSGEGDDARRGARARRWG